MPRGFAEIYSEQTNLEMFSDIEKMLNAKKFRLENPRTNYVQVWNEAGDMLELSREELLPHIVEGNSLIIFWNDSGDSISITFNEDVHGMSKSVLLLDGFDAKESESLFHLIKLFTLSKHNNKFKGFIFDRIEISENVEWDKCLQNGKLIMDTIRNELRMVSQKIITTNSSIDFDINNVYVIIRKADDAFELSEFNQNN